MDRTYEVNHEQSSTPREFLDEVYNALHFHDGDLYDAVELPIDHTTDEWVEKGDWLSVASEIGAEKVFFVNNDPVIVFCAQEHAEEAVLCELFRRYWCMARPQCLFMALPGELRVYSLNQEPATPDTWDTVRPIDVVRKVADVAELLSNYRREQVETGRLFQEKHFGDIEERADKRLIKDLKLVRKALLDAGLEVRYAHALIGRSIFIRYLEDREILTPAYFEAVAAENPQWENLLSSDYSLPLISSTSHKRLYDRVLQDKTFTYALFRQLAIDFNGDMFPRDQEEEKAVNQSHLDLLRGFLFGNPDLNQLALFLWAYDFEIIPIDLISSIYEEFYHQSNAKDDKGTHYTPAVLVEYVLSEVLTDKCLARNPRILDPACGSGVFLVEAFRRIVRSQVQQVGRKLTSDELRKILREQIAGIEINAEAVHVAAFSLYLALLHYQDPPDIRENPKLPNLIYRANQADNDDFGILFNNDALGLTNGEYAMLTDKLESESRFKGRTDLQRFIEASEMLAVSEHSFDIVIGNPPWGKVPSELSHQQNGWCEAFSWPNSYKESSQAFIARVFALLKPSGECGFLVPTGVFFKSHPISQEFRSRWLGQATLKTVVNFAHVRHVFFSSADAPFAFVHFEAKQPSKGHKFRYWSAKRTDIVDQHQVVVLSLNDLKQVEQAEMGEHSYLWKVYWWGSHRDAALIRSLSLNTSIGDFISERVGVDSHRGFKPPSSSGSDSPSDWLSEFMELPDSSFHRYGPVDKNEFIKVPDEVLHRGSREIYEGWRILVRRTLRNINDEKGFVIARLEETPYCSRSVIGFSLDRNVSDWERKVIIGIMWSSLARYFLFLISSGWGVYRYEIIQTELKSLPIRFPRNIDLRNRIVEIVDKLLNRQYDPSGFVIDIDILMQVRFLEKELDEAIFELYGLIEPERSLVEDMCGIGLELLYRETSQGALSPVQFDTTNLQGTITDLVVSKSEEYSLESYLHTFLKVWNRELEPDGEFSWHVIRPRNIPMIAVIFSTQEKGKLVLQDAVEHTLDWDTVLQRCATALPQKISQRIYIDGMVRVVTNTEIYIIKRDERRLWTQSMAYEDSEATRLQMIHLQQITTL